MQDRESGICEGKEEAFSPGCCERRIHSIRKHVLFGLRILLCISEIKNRIRRNIYGRILSHADPIQKAHDKCSIYHHRVGISLGRIRHR